MTTASRSTPTSNMPISQALGALVDRLDRDARCGRSRKSCCISSSRCRAISRGNRRSARWRGAISSSTRPTIPMTRSRRRARSAIAASPRNPARASTSRSINATRAAKWSAGGEKCFIAGEDLTCQAGLAVQQDLALGALIGVTHAERNGHHYVDGFGRYAGRRGGGVSRRASRSLCPRRQQGPARDPRRRSPDGIADDTRALPPPFIRTGPRCSRASTMTTKRLGLIMNGVTGRMGLNQHLIRSIIAIRDQGGVLLANGDRMMPDPILVGRTPTRSRRSPSASTSSAGPPISTRRWPTRTTPSSSTPRPRRRGRRC
jgi:hypothetical protein